MWAKGGVGRRRDGRGEEGAAAAPVLMRGKDCLLARRGVADAVAKEGVWGRGRLRGSLVRGDRLKRMASGAELGDERGEWSACSCCSSCCCNDCCFCFCSCMAGRYEPVSSMRSPACMLDSSPRTAPASL